MSSVSVQNYLLTIYRMQKDRSPVGTTMLATRLGVAPASVTGMIHKLRRQGLVQHMPYRGTILTPAGEWEALRLLRRHRLWELFLTDVLGLAWDEVHEEAHRLEHATSKRVADRLATYLDEPESDPHGQPIPRRDGTLPSRTTIALSEVEAGQVVRLVEVPDDDPELLRYLGSLGLSPGAEVQVIAVSPSGGPLTIRLEESERSLEWELAGRLLVTPMGTEEEEQGA